MLKARNVWPAKDSVRRTGINRIDWSAGQIPIRNNSQDRTRRCNGLHASPDFDALGAVELDAPVADPGQFFIDAVQPYRQWKRERRLAR